MANERNFIFGQALRDRYKQGGEVSQAMTQDAAYKFQADWKSRFGNRLAQWGSDNSSPSPELRPSTLKNRRMRGYQNQEPLYDPTMDHVPEWGTIRDSIKVSTQEIRRRGFFTEVWNAVYTDHPLFPINEFGFGVPVRMTLAPTIDAEGGQFATNISTEYRNLLVRKYRAGVGTEEAFNAFFEENMRNEGME